VRAIRVSGWRVRPRVMACNSRARRRGLILAEAAKCVRLRRVICSPCEVVLIVHVCRATTNYRGQTRRRKRSRPTTTIAKRTIIVWWLYCDLVVVIASLTVRRKRRARTDASGRAIRPFRRRACRRACRLLTHPRCACVLCAHWV
jgi:hypothetical protein